MLFFCAIANNIINKDKNAFIQFLHQELLGDQNNIITKV